MDRQLFCFFFKEKASAFESLLCTAGPFLSVLSPLACASTLNTVQGEFLFCGLVFLTSLGSFSHQLSGQDKLATSFHLFFSHRFSCVLLLLNGLPGFSSTRIASRLLPCPSTPWTHPGVAAAPRRTGSRRPRFLLEAAVADGTGLGRFRKGLGGRLGEARGKGSRL